MHSRQCRNYGDAFELSYGTKDHFICIGVLNICDPGYFASNIRVVVDDGLEAGGWPVIQHVAVKGCRVDAAKETLPLRWMWKQNA